MRAKHGGRTVLHFETANAYHHTDGRQYKGEWRSYGRSSLDYMLIRCSGCKYIPNGAPWAKRKIVGRWYVKVNDDCFIWVKEPESVNHWNKAFFLRLEGLVRHIKDVVL